MVTGHPYTLPSALTRHVLVLLSHFRKSMCRGSTAASRPSDSTETSQRAAHRAPPSSNKAEQFFGDKVALEEPDLDGIPWLRPLPLLGP